MNSDLQSKRDGTNSEKSTNEPSCYRNPISSRNPSCLRNSDKGTSNGSKWREKHEKNKTIGRSNHELPSVEDHDDNRYDADNEGSSDIRDITDTIEMTRVEI